MSDCKSVVLLGGGGHALSCAEVVLKSDSLNLVGYIAPSASDELKSYQIEYLGDDSIISECVRRGVYFHIAVGQIKTAEIRIKLHSTIAASKARLVSLIAETAYMAKTADLGAGSFVGQNSVLNACAKIGENCIINTGAIIEHGARIGAHCHIAPGAIVLGNVEVGDRSFVGAGAVIREGMKVRAGSVVPAGKCLMNDS